MDKKPKKPIKFKVVKPKKEEKPKKKPIKFKVVKKEEKPKPKKKMKFKVVKISDAKLDKLKKEAKAKTKEDGIKRRVLPTGEVQKKKPSEIKRVSGVGRKTAKKLDPAELFGKLPVELRLKILNPKETGVKVGGPQLNQRQLSILDTMVGELVSGEFYLGTFSDMDNIFSKRKSYMDKQEDRVLKISKQIGTLRDKFFNEKLINTLEDMDKKDMLKGYDYLNKSFHNSRGKVDLLDAIDEMAVDREDYYLGNHLGIDKINNDGRFVPTSRTKKELIEYIDEYRDVKNLIKERIADFKAIKN